MFTRRDRELYSTVPQVTNHPFTILIVIGNLTYNQFSSNVLSAFPRGTTDKMLYLSTIEAGGNHEQNRIT
jgi:hypothetical protein